MESPVPDDRESQHVGCQDVSALPDEEVVEGDVEVGGPESSDELLVPQDIVAVGKVVAEGAAESSVLKWGITASVIYLGRQVSKKLGILSPKQRQTRNRKCCSCNVICDYSASLLFNFQPGFD